MDLKTVDDVKKHLHQKRKDAEDRATDAIKMGDRLRAKAEAEYLSRLLKDIK